jgi:hypothetical protein
MTDPMTDPFGRLKTKDNVRVSEDNLQRPVRK